MHWDNNTNCPADDVLRAVSGRLKVINLEVADVSKSNVDKVFRDVFGYSTLIDPFQSFGFAIRKSERQAAHDATIIPLPYKQEPGFIYQRILDSRCQPSLCHDIRLPVFKNEIPFGFLKYRLIADPIRSLYSVEFIEDIQTILSPGEIGNVLMFAKRFGLEFGEIDLIRNNSDGRIYILDVNNMAGNAMFKYMKSTTVTKIQSLYVDIFQSKFIL